MQAFNLVFDNLKKQQSADNLQSMEESVKIKSKNKIYWICQISGWTLYAVLNIIGTIVFDKLNVIRVVSFLFLSFAALSFTHIIRNRFKKKGWKDLPLKKLLMNIIGSSIIMGVLLSLIYYSINLATGITKFHELKAAAFLISISNLSIVVFAWMLIYITVHLFENYKKAEIESLIWEAAVKDFELKTLKSQLNPHFMFNAMNSIRALIEEDPESAKTAVTKLSNILRYSLKIERTETVPLEEEMQTVEDYLALESIRYEERLRYNINIDPRSKNIDIPPMMIQTLVENGIKHGISKRKEGGFINISSCIEGTDLNISITNSGSISEEDLKHSKGFGINNTKHRLNLLYGEKGVFSIKNKNNNEVSAEIKIPSGGKINESFNN